MKSVYEGDFIHGVCQPPPYASSVYLPANSYIVLVWCIDECSIILFTSIAGASSLQKRDIGTGTTGMNYWVSGGVSLGMSASISGNTKAYRYVALKGI